MTQCRQCGQSILDGEEVVSKQGDALQVLCRPCAQQRADGAGSAQPAAGGAIFSPTPANPVPAPRAADHARNTRDLFGALLLGALAAGAGTVIWYATVVLTHIQFGLIAGLVGFAVGYAVVFGSRGERGRRLQILSVTLTLVAMVIGEYLVTRHALLAASGGTVTLPLLAPPLRMLQVVIASLTSNAFSLLTLVIWAIAIYGALYVPRELHLPHRG